MIGCSAVSDRQTSWFVSCLVSFLMLTLPSSTLVWTKWSISSSEGMADVNYLLLCPTSERAQLGTIPLTVFSVHVWNQLKILSSLFIKVFVHDEKDFKCNLWFLFIYFLAENQCRNAGDQRCRVNTDCFDILAGNLRRLFGDFTPHASWGLSLSLTGTPYVTNISVALRYDTLWYMDRQDTILLHFSEYFLHSLKLCFGSLSCWSNLSSNQVLSARYVMC